jgi:hypothetical protein
MTPRMIAANLALCAYLTGMASTDAADAVVRRVKLPLTGSPVSRQATNEVRSQSSLPQSVPSSVGAPLPINDHGSGSILTTLKHSSISPALPRQARLQANDPTPVIVESGSLQSNGGSTRRMQTVSDNQRGGAIYPGVDKSSRGALLIP